jgi:putative transposase
MPQSLANVLVHLVFSTKHRTPWLKDAALREQLYAVIGQALKDVDCHPIKIGGVADHVHIFFALSRKVAIMKVVEEVKTESTKWLKKHAPSLSDFHWQAGYGAFSVSAEVITYIERQEEHHRKLSYQDEFRELCRRHGIEIDERYVWD